MSKLIETDLDDNELAQTFAKAGYWQDAKDPAKAMVKILGGREIGVGPMASMREINIIKGKIELSASLMARLVKESAKYDYQVVTHTTEKCVIQFYQNGEKIGQSDFTIEDAEKAGLVRDGSPWEKYPKNMLFARALSNGVKWHCPDVTGGSVYHEGELSDAPDIEPVDGDTTAEMDADVVEGNVSVDDESGSGDNGEERPEWADEWLDRSISQIKDAYAQDKVTLDGIIDRERQLPEDEQRKTLLDWANAQLDKQEADTEAHDPEEAQSLA
jgi:hypothetical protein